jgi:hypothetical protein
MSSSKASPSSMGSMKGSSMKASPAPAATK